MGDDMGAVMDTSETLVSAAKKRDRSQIEFPYTDLERAVDLVTALHTAGGQAEIEQTQLAVAMDQSATGGTFRARLGAARTFRLIETEGGRVKLSSLGIRVIDEATSAHAKAEAFLHPALYSAMYEKYNGQVLPPAAAIERQMEALGVPPKQKERARQSFASSASYAGFISQTGRFCKPPLGALPADPKAEPLKNNGQGNGNEGGELPPSLHPFVTGLLRELPPAKSDWSVAQRADWLTAAAHIFKLIYKGEGTIEIAFVSSPSKQTAVDQ